MKQILFGANERPLSSIVLGLMRISKLSEKELIKLLDTAIECDINTLDIADIYGGGLCETALGKLFAHNSSLRDRFFVQSKCGINKTGRCATDGSSFTFFDFSRDHILRSVDGILQRLHTDHLDSLLLHRPDVLMEPDEICEAFTQLRQSGKVLEFGVSNQNPQQMQLLQAALPFSLTTNQIQMSCAFSPTIDAGFNVNMQNALSVMHDGGILEYCRLHNMTIQAWSVMQYGFFEGVFINSPKYPKLNATLNAIAAAHNTTPTAIALAWILRIPAKMQAIIGTTRPERVRQSAAAAAVTLSREEWYEIYISVANVLP